MNLGWGSGDTIHPIATISRKVQWVKSQGIRKLRFM